LIAISNFFLPPGLQKPTTWPLWWINEAGCTGFLGHVAGCHVSAPALYGYYAEPVCNQGLVPGYADVKHEGIDHGLRTLLDCMTTSD
jgi:hypothetical protein